MPIEAHYNYLQEYMATLLSKGKYSFTWEDLQSDFDLSSNALQLALARLKNKNEVAAVRKEFYVIVPPEYRVQGMLPPSFFVDGLMKFLKRDYYVGLLSAAAYYGAAHQQAQAYFVIAAPQIVRPIHTSKIRINFYYRKSWESEDLIERKTETGFIKVSAPELTALDLVFFQNRVGGLDRVATVLDELAEAMDAEKLALAAARYHKTTAVQRLGYILDHVLGRVDLCKPLLNYLDSIRHFPTLLQPSAEAADKITGNPWNIIPNTEIETDL